MQKVLGLDIGVASVGWGIIDIESGKVIDAGVRLFQEADKENNAKRRGFRSARRLKRRKVVRKQDLIKILKKHNLYYENPNNLINPYAIRCKGLNEALTVEELNVALLHICKHRGSSLEVVEEDEKKAKEQGETKKALAENDEKLNAGKYVCEIQYEIMQSKDKVRGNKNNFRSSDYRTELEKLLNTQKIEDKIAKEIIDCILRRRHFSEGPGSFKSQTIYGQVFDEDGKVIMNMIEKMTGKCTFFKDQLRAPKYAPTAEFFNLLNDLNNLRLNNDPLEIELKQELIKYAFEKGSLTPKKIASEANVALEDIKGFRIDKKGEPLITKLEGFNAFRKIFVEYGNTEVLKDFEFLDTLAEILTKTKVIDERIRDIKELKRNLDIKVVEEIAKLAKFTTYHSLSLKALRVFNEELYVNTLNQMQIVHASEKFNFNNVINSQRGHKNIAIDQEAVLSPVAMRSYRQAIKVVNKAREKYGEFNSIVIETTRSKNSQEEKKRINDLQKANDSINKEVIELIEKKYGGNVQINAKLRNKIRLYMEQDGKTAYTQQPVDLRLLIEDPYAYEIDHIIPLSISLDDSLVNKVLASRTENQEKGQLTPYMAFQRNKFSNGSLKEYYAFAKYLKSKKERSINWKKYNYLMYEGDIGRYENMQEFIARNLVDTSYANRLVLNTLQTYFKDNEVDTKIHTIKGSATSAFRKRIKGLDKDRDKDYAHHAIDALIVASIKKLNLYDKLLKNYYLMGKDVVVNKETGEVIEANDELILDKKYINFLNELVHYQVKNFSHQVDTKPNRSIADQTIYSTRRYDDVDFVIKKYKNIYDSKFFALANDIIQGNIDKYLMQKHDHKTFEKLTNIVRHYYEEFKEDKEKIKQGKKGIEFTFNPFDYHLRETGEYMSKYAKKGNGPVITAMSYVDGRLGSHVDISRNYDLKNKKVVLQQISSYRTDFYLDNGVYKFVTIKYADIKYSKSENLYIIDEEWYKEQKTKKKISDTAQFCFSLHRNEYIEITSDNNKVLWKFTATNNDKKNVIEVKPCNYNSKERFMPTIGNKIQNLKKYSCDVLGQLTEIKDSKLKFKFK